MPRSPPPELSHVSINDLRLQDRMDTAVNSEFKFGTMTNEEQTTAEIDSVTAMLRALEQERATFTSVDDPAVLIANLERDTIIRNHLVKLRNKRNTLQWRSFASEKSVFSLDPVVLDRLLDIQRETATSTGALAAVGAGISLSILYSGTRGDMWPFFASWWFFVISLATTSALGFSASATTTGTSNDLLETSNTGNDAGGTLQTPSNKGWIVRRLSVVLVFISLISVVGGWACLAAAVGGYSVSDEIHGLDPRITDGPDLGTQGQRTWTKWVQNCLIAFFGGSMVGGYLFRLRLFSRAWRYAIPSSTGTQSEKA